jgi:hypothetical protein
MIRTWLTGSNDKNSLLKEYKKYRTLGKEIANQIIEQFTDEKGLRSIGKLMGIARGKEFVFESELEVDLFMDFSFNEYRVNDKTFIQRYLEQEPEISEEVQTFLEAKLNSYTSLFRIVAADPKISTVSLVDLLNLGNQVDIIDINLSKSAPLGILMFTRIVSLPNLNMTSGIFCCFPKQYETIILKKWKTTAKKVPSDVESIQRFVAFFKLNRTYGLSGGTKKV